jgi:hypothetical protein
MKINFYTTENIVSLLQRKLSNAVTLLSESFHVTAHKIHIDNTDSYQTITQPDVNLTNADCLILKHASRTVTAVL